jgi:protein-tyrosine-phosphatase
MIHIKQGDLIIGVEDRHLPYLHTITKDNTDVQITLLGLWITPVKCPLLYDPHHLSDEYFDACFQRIENAIQGIKSKLTLY